MRSLQGTSTPPSEDDDELVTMNWVREPLWIAATQLLVLSIGIPLLAGLPVLTANGCLILVLVGVAIWLGDAQHPLFRACLHVSYAASGAGIAWSVFVLGLPGSIVVYYAPITLLGAAHILGARAACFWAVPSLALVAASEFLPRPTAPDPVGLVPFVVGGGVVLTMLALSVSLRRAYDRQAEQLQRLAATDPLTGLRNRRELELALRRAVGRAHRFDRRGALVYVDLDGLKAVNDSHGHEAGDRVLREAARRIVSATREIDTVARLGGDEFVVIQSEFDDPKGAEVFARRLLSRMAEPYLVDGSQISVGASIGFTSFRGRDESAADLLRAADHAMYAAKRAGGNRIFQAAPDGQWTRVKCPTPTPGKGAGYAATPSGPRAASDPKKRTCA